jgi:hypothetical protein
MDCQYCKKTFNNKYTLGQHQKTAKYCLDLQGIANTSFICTYCSKKLCTNDRLYTHYQSCKEKNKIEVTKDIEAQNVYLKKTLSEKNEYISKLEENIAKLEAKLEKFENVVSNIAATTHMLKAKATKTDMSTTNSNNTMNVQNITVNNVLNLSEERVKKVLSERLNYNVVYAGQAGLATFVVDNILKDETGKLIYRCVDSSRQMFEFVDENGETIRDMKAEKLTQSLLKGDVIKIGLEAAAVGWNTDDQKLNTDRVSVFGSKVNEYADLNRNNAVFRSKVSSLTT